MDEAFADEESYYAANRRAGRFSYSDKFPVSREFRDGETTSTVGDFGRYAYQVFDPDEHIVLSTGKGAEVILRETPSRQQIKAMFFQSDRQIGRLIFQRFNATGKALQDSFNFGGEEIELLRDFLRLIENLEIDGADARDDSDAATIRNLLDNPETTRIVYGTSRPTSSH